MNPTIDRSLMYGYVVRNPRGFAGISNKVFDMMIVEYFITKDRKSMRVDSVSMDGLYF